MAGLVLAVPACSRRYNSSCQLRVKSIYSRTLGYVSNYSYSVNGRLNAVFTSNGNNTIYEYTDSRIFGKTTDCAGNIIGKSTCFLNNAGLVDSLVNISASNHIESKKFIYSPTGFAVEEKNMRMAGLVP